MQLLKVREAVSILDLDVMFYPCPAGGPTWREKVKKKGGKASFPYMVDPNTGVPLAVPSPATVTFYCLLNLTW